MKKARRDTLKARLRALGLTPASALAAAYAIQGGKAPDDDGDRFRIALALKWIAVELDRGPGRPPKAESALARARALAQVRAGNATPGRAALGALGNGKFDALAFERIARSARNARKKAR